MKEGLNMHYPYVSKTGAGDFPTPAPFPAPAPFPDLATPASAPLQFSAEPSPRPTALPSTPAETNPEPPLVNPIEYTGPETPFGSTGIPIVTPEPPHFSVPSNPLLPPEYKEILSYENLQYLNGFLRTQIGKECMVMMTVGASGNVISRIGFLIGIGINYLLLQDSCSETIFVCDFYSVRMVQILGNRCPLNLLI
jgi:hypothetical protein